MLTDQEEKDLKHFIRWRAVQLLREAKSHRHGIFSCRDFHHAVEETAWKILFSRLLVVRLYVLGDIMGARFAVGKATA